MEKKTNKSYTNPKAIRYFLSTMVIVIVILLIQILLLLLLYMSFFFNSSSSVYYGAAYLSCHAISVLVVLSIVNRKCPTAYKLAWVVPILLFPLAGGWVYLLARSRNLHKIARKRIISSRRLLDGAMPKKEQPPRDRLGSFSTLPPLLEKEGFPAFTDTECRYLCSGEAYFQSLIEDLQRAEKFIFLEFFIIHEGIMWDTVLDILEEKAKKGVTVRILYDGMGSLKTLPYGYCKKLRKKGIDAKIFQRFVPLLSTMQNNRDHRKIVVIDGKVAYTGGVNLSDEYINEYDRFGHWLDSGIRLEGQAVAPFVRFFLEMWYTNHAPDPDPSIFFCNTPKAADGWVIPYCDAPIFESNCTRDLYLTLINSVRSYIYITTPYLIPGDDLLSALCLAAKGGVDVRLITPFHGDHKIVHMISRSYYKELTDAGVRIYEYLPGFIHSKNFVSDDVVCSVGTANLDYRSLYLHYECGALCFEGTAVQAVKDDFLKTVGLSKEIKPTKLPLFSSLQRLLISVIRLFEPML
ncbi:MAG: cardiolipin synthase [Clostridia bacterium]|nr:cardiolipin synthase [Clostridia bacterium]